MLLLKNNGGIIEIESMNLQIKLKLEKMIFICIFVVSVVNSMQIAANQYKPFAAFLQELGIVFVFVLFLLIDIEKNKGCNSNSTCPLELQLINDQYDCRTSIDSSVGAFCNVDGDILQM